MRRQVFDLPDYVRFSHNIHYARYRLGPEAPSRATTGTLPASSTVALVPIEALS